MESEALVCSDLSTQFNSSLLTLATQAYIYWTENSAFHRMKALFGLTFCPQYRADLILDGLTDCIESGKWHGYKYVRYW